MALTATGQALHHATADDMIELRRDLIAGALTADDLAALDGLRRQVLTGIERRLPPQPSADDALAAGA